MTNDELAALHALSGCRFLLASWDKRFVRDLGERAAADASAALSPKQQATLWRLVVKYRGQIGEGDLVDFARAQLMDSQAWEDCSSPIVMLNFLREKISQRKLRLFAAAACDAGLSPFGVDSVHRLHAIRVAEQFADGEAGHDLRCSARSLVHPYVEEHACADGDMLESAKKIVSHDHRKLAIRQAVLLRCIAGNPWKPIYWSDDPKKHAEPRTGERRTHPRDVSHVEMRRAWLTPEVQGVASAIYTERRWGEMPILADALEDAGCGSVEILAHCRSGGVHVRGCWVVDLILGKE